MALAVGAAQRGRRAALVGFLVLTLLGGLVFMGVKGVEYTRKWDHRLVPGQARIQYWFSADRSSADEAVIPPKQFHPDEEYVREHLAHAGYENLDEDQLARRIDNLRTFMGIYFGLTGLHALHVIVGIGVIAWLLVGAVLGRYGSQSFTPVDMVGLYWHLVDMIWIFLFPLLYLIH
jgi:cytochrome c oxidase subunit 3